MTGHLEVAEGRPAIQPWDAERKLERVALAAARGVLSSAGKVFLRPCRPGIVDLASHALRRLLRKGQRVSTARV